MPDRESRKKQITAKRREQILGAALEVFAKKGYEAATIPEIARTAGVAAGTIYIYYPGKRELFVAVIENLMVTPLNSIFQKQDRQGFPDTMKEALYNRIQLVQGGNLAPFLALMGEIQREPELRTLFVEKLVRPFMANIEALYRIRMESGEFRRMDPAVVVRLVGGMMIGLTLLKTMEGEASPLNRVPPDELADEILNFILNGVQSDKGKTESPKPGRKIIEY